MAGFVFRLIPPRPDVVGDMSADARVTMTEPVAYRSELAREGRVLAFGPVNDPSGPYGIGIVVADDLEAAEAVRDGDPVVRSSHGFQAESAPMFQFVTPDGLR